MANNMTDFFSWEKASRDIIDFKKIYADMADCDIIAGLALSEIVYWHLPSKDGQSKLRVEHDGKLWIAVRRYEWWDRTRMTPDQADRVLKILVQKGLIEKKVFKFNGDPTVHVRIIEDKFLRLWHELAGKETKNPFDPKQNSISVETENQLGNYGSPITESTSEGTSENLIPPTTSSSAAAPEPEGKLITELEAETIYQKVTGFMSMPSRDREEAVRIICDIARVKGSATVTYLQPFYQKYILTKGKNGCTYSRTSYGWLDYAATGTMPTDYSAPPVAAPAQARSSAPSAKPQSAAEKRQAAFAAARERYKDNGDSQ